MKTLKKAACLLLALLMTVTCVACASGQEGTGDGTAATTVSNDAWAIDFSGKDYQNADFTIMRADLETGHALTGSPNDIWVEEMSNDILSNAVYQRNQELKAMLKVNIVMELVAMGDELTKKLDSSIMSGDGTYDLVILHMRGFPSLVNNGLVTSMNGLNLDTSYSWWDQNAGEALNIGGNQYGLVSDVTFLDKLATIGVFYNTTMANELQLPDIYEVVDNGEWTLEKMKEYAKIAAGSVSSTGEQVYGISSQNDFSYYVIESANFATVSKNSQGGLDFTLPSDRAVGILQDAFTVMNENYFFNRQMEKGSHPEGYLTPDEMTKRFGDGSLFQVSILQYFYYMKNYYDNYGILPMPKYDSATDGYYSPINHHAATIMTMPSSSENNEFTADVLQAWGMISEKIVNPEFYDRILSTRMVNDVNSVRMVDIILENRVYDIGLIFNFGSLETALLKSTSYAIKQAPSTVMSDIYAKQSSVPAAIEEFLSKIK